MDWVKRLNQAIEFIEENLDGELDYEDVAGIAGCPSYYFQQMFLYMTDMTLREYIRRRRLSLAAVELQKGNRKVTDIVMKYGYESPTAFTRAFKNFHGTTPSALKTEPVLYLWEHAGRLFPEIKGELGHNYKAAYSQGIDNMLTPMDTDSFQPALTHGCCWRKSMAIYLAATGRCFHPVNLPRIFWKRIF